MPVLEEARREGSPAAKAAKDSKSQGHTGQAPGGGHAQAPSRSALKGMNYAEGAAALSPDPDGVKKAWSGDASAERGKESLTLERTRDFELDDDHQMGSGTKATAGREGGSLERTQKSRIKDAETGVVESTRTARGAGYDREKGLTASAGSEKTTEIDGKKITTGRSGSVSKDGIDLTFQRERSETDADGNESKRSRSTQVHAGPDGASVTHEVNGTAVSAGGDVALDKRGNPTKVKAEAGVSRKGKSLSAKAGYEVKATVRQVGGLFVVDWERKLSGGANAKAKGAGVEAGGEDTRFGSRAFDNEIDAKAFQENAASRLPPPSQDPATVAGAKHMAIGEMRGTGRSSKLGASGSASFAGGGAIGGGVSRSAAHSVSVRRVSENGFEITYDEGSGVAGNLEGSTPVYGMSASRSTSEGVSRTVRVDVSTPKGRAAFERFTRQSGLVTEGARLTRTTVTKGEESSKTASVLGATNTRYGKYGEAVTTGDEGRTARFTGSGGKKYEGGVLDSSHDRSGVELGATEVDRKTSQYSLTGFVDSSKGGAARHNLHDLTGTVIDSDESAGAKSSGKWEVEVAITPELIRQFIDRVDDEAIRKMGLFDGDDPRNNLRVALRDAKDTEDQKRALAHYAQALGGEGKLIRAMRNAIWGLKNNMSLQGDYESMRRNQVGNFDYDLALEGDRNFRGAAARRAQEAKIAGFARQLKADPTGAGALHAEIFATLTEVRRQRAEIADPKRYRDLPRQLREMQVARLDGQVSQLEALASQAGAAFTEADAAVAAPAGKGKDAGRKGKGKSDPTTQAAGPGDGPARALQSIRAAIGRADKAARAAKAEYQGSQKYFKTCLYVVVMKQYRGSALPPEALSAQREARALEQAALGLAQVARTWEAGSDDLRSAFILALAEPAAAASLGPGVQARMKSLADAWEAAAGKMTDAYSRLLEVADINLVESLHGDAR